MKSFLPGKFPPSPEHAALPRQKGATAARLSIGRRFLLFLACLAVGLAIGFLGQGMTSQSTWFLAVPVCIAIGWLFVANPAECVAPQCPPQKDDSV